jgi:hypothetical protein
MRSQINAQTPVPLATGLFSHIVLYIALHSCRVFLFTRYVDITSSQMLSDHADINQGWLPILVVRIPYSKTT